MINLFETLFSTTLPVLGSFLVIYLTFIKEQVIEKRNINHKQLDNFYIPFYKLYCRGFLFNTSLANMDIEARSKVLDLLSQNIQYMMPGSQFLYIDFYAAFLDLLEAEDKNPDFPLEETKNNFDEIFNKLSNCILKEYKSLLKKVYLPVPLSKTIFHRHH